MEVLTLLREFFLLGRGEFAIALISEADEKIRSRWRRSDNLGYEKKNDLGSIVVKDGEVSAILGRTWAAMGSLLGQHEDQDEDDIFDMARDLIQLSIVKSTTTPAKTTIPQTHLTISSTPFKNFLLSVPVLLGLSIPSPLDLFLTQSDIQIYSTINAYLLSIHRAHLRLTDLWKITSLRRHHPAPPGGSTAGRSKVLTLRDRTKDRSAAMRSVWATSSAAVFFLSETEAYLQGEVVQGTWLGFQKWLTGKSASRPSSARSAATEEDIWLQAGQAFTTKSISPAHDPQTLADAHRRYLSALSSSLLLTNTSFTNPLYHCLQQIDHLVALVHRMHSIWSSLDLEADEGVVDAFSDFHKEEGDVKAQLIIVAEQVKNAIEALVKALREVDHNKDGWDSGFEELVLGEEGVYVPPQVGRVDRLLMKLDFGGWFGDARREDDDGLGIDNEF
jgi:hypothetical protein